MKKLMLIDDDRDIHFAMQKAALSFGYEYCGAFDGDSGLHVLAKEKPDILLLDVMMPGVNGFELCRTIRTRGHKLPIIFLSAKGDIVDKSIGFKAGGDDYVVKPFNTEELFLRIEAHLRRKDHFSFSSHSDEKKTLHIGELELNFSSYEAYRNKERIDLTAKEFEILALLASNPGEVFTRDQIYSHIWGEQAVGNLDSVTVFIRKIREKIESNPSQPLYVLTVWRVGYKFINYPALDPV